MNTTQLPDQIAPPLYSAKPAGMEEHSLDETVENQIGELLGIRATPNPFKANSGFQIVT